MPTSARRLIGLSMVPPLAREVADQMNNGVGKRVRLVEAGMVPRLAAHLASMINSGNFSVQKLCELGMVPALAREIVFSTSFPELDDVDFSARLQAGVPLSGVFIYDVPAGVAVSTTVPGITINDALRPIPATGTPSAAVGYTITQTGSGYINSPYVSSGTVLPAVPLNTVLPVITGLNEEGQTLSCSTGTWTNSPTSYGYQWFRKSAGNIVTAITGAFNASYIATTADVGFTLSCRVRAFNAGGGGQPYEVFTAYTAAITAASPAPPVNTVAPAISGNRNIGDALTTTDGTWTGASGAATYQWMRDGVAISGANASTYKTSWADANRSVTCQITRTNGSGSITPALSNALSTYAVIASGFYNGAEWTTTTKHRYIPENQVNPIEIGAARNDARPGTGLLGFLSDSNSQPAAIDTRCDVLGNGVFSGTLTKAVYKLNGGNYIRLHRFEPQGAELDCARYVRGIYIEGPRFDATGKPERDQLTLGGTTGVSPGPTHTIQDAFFTGTHSTNLATYISSTDKRINTIPVLDARMISSSQMQLTLTDAPLSGIPLAALGGKQSILIYGSSYRGANRQNYDANQNWDVVSVTGGGGAGSIVVLNCGDTTGRPAFTAGNPANINVFDFTGAVVIALGCQQNPPLANVPHADNWQLNKDKPSRDWRMHRVHGIGGYQAGGIVGNSSLSDNAKFWSLVTLKSDISVNPQDRSTTLLFTGGQAFTPAYTNEYFEVYGDNTDRPYQGINGMFYPNTGIGSYGATVLANSDGAPILAYLGTTGYLGSVTEGKPADGRFGASGGMFVASTGANKPGNGYQSRGYGDLRAPVEADLPADPFLIGPGLTTGGTPGHLNMKAAAANGTEIGDVTLSPACTLPGNCVSDIYISDATGNLVANSQIKFEGIIAKKIGTLTAGPYSFYVTVKVNVLDTDFNRVFTGIQRTKLISETVV